ncbi:hypothetical protein GCM10023217_31530 [Gordonia alkaliphila]|uniref:Uncharacterized protein n=1 Tax=Gordonia alkaliphila TaxID=1053547 RepID=A0ABP8ZHQ2_9ACTN
MPMEVSESDLAEVEVVLFRSTSTFIAVVAFDAGTDEGFDLPDQCEATALAGPDGAGGFTVPWPMEEIPGADAVRGTHSILRDTLTDPTFNQFVFLAQVRGTLRVMVVVAPEMNAQPRARSVAPEPGLAALRSAVEKLAA